MSKTVATVIAMCLISFINTGRYEDWSDNSTYCASGSGGSVIQIYNDNTLYNRVERKKNQGNGNGNNGNGDENGNGNGNDNDDSDDSDDDDFRRGQFYPRFKRRNNRRRRCRSRSRRRSRSRSGSSGIGFVPPIVDDANARLRRLGLVAGAVGVGLVLKNRQHHHHVPTVIQPPPVIAPPNVHTEHFHKYINVRPVIQNNREIFNREVVREVQNNCAEAYYPGC
jgi:hypothetical protein